MAVGRVAVIGAGPAGLVCADELRRSGRADEVVVFEKSRGIGGRVSTRAVTMDDGRPISFDHGTPALRPGSDDFAALLARLAASGNAAEWRDGLTVGTPGMRDLFAPLAGGLDVRLEARVGALRREHRRWHLGLAPHEREGGRAEGEEGPFDRVVFAIPAHQAVALLTPVAPRLARMLGVIHLKPCWTLMAAFEGASDPVGASTLDGAEWLVREHEKPGRAWTMEHPGLRAYTLQMSADWSTARLEWDREAVTGPMMDVLRARTGETGEPLIVMAHRWRYSHTIAPLGEPYVESDGLVAGGDWTGGACVENAWESGCEMARFLLEG